MSDWTPKPTVLFAKAAENSQFVRFPQTDDRVAADFDDVLNTLALNGYIVIDPHDLPEVTENGEERPKLPPRWAQGDGTLAKTEIHRQQALGNLALERWYARYEARVEKRRDALRMDIQQAQATIIGNQPDRLAEHLLGKGWKK